MSATDPLPAEQDALRQMERIAFTLVHVRLLLSHGCFGAHAGLELRRLCGQIAPLLELFDLSTGDKTAIARYYTVRQHRAGESALMRMYGPAGKVPNTVPSAWYAEWLRSTP